MFMTPLNTLTRVVRVDKIASCRQILIWCGHSLISDCGDIRILGYQSFISKGVKTDSGFAAVFIFSHR